MIRTFNRFELKYLTAADQVLPLAGDLSGYLAPDEHGTAGTYAITSLYYDSPDLVCYWAKLDGLKVRRKLRIRHYETSAALTVDDPVFVEIKQRVNRVTQKRRIRLPYGEALALCSGTEAAPQLDGAVAGEVADLVGRFELRPTAVTSYLRSALVGGERDPGVRVTFDSDVRYRTTELDLGAKVAGSHMIPPATVVMEVKVNDRVPAWLTRLVSRHDLTLVRMSKYCRAVEAGQLHATGAEVAAGTPERRGAGGTRG